MEMHRGPDPTLIDYSVMLTGRGLDIRLRGASAAAPTHTIAQGEVHEPGRL